MKKSFILHIDSLEVLDELTNEQKGQLFTAIRDYNLGREVELTGLMKAVFVSFKKQFDREGEKYNDHVKKKALSGKMGNLKRHHPEIYKQVVDNELSIEEAEELAYTRTTSQTVAQPRTWEKEPRKQSQTSLVSDSVSVSVSDSVSILKVKTFNDNVKNTYLSILKYFPKELQPKNKVEQEKWMTEVERLLRIDNIPENVLLEIVKKARADKFWSKNFLSIRKLRKKKDGVSYVQYFYESLVKDQKSEKKVEVLKNNLEIWAK